MSRKATLSFLVTFFKMLENTLDNKKKIRFPIAVILACMGLMNFGNAQAQNVDVTIPSGGFEIDANLQSNSPINTGDWVQGPGPGSGGHVLENDGTPVDPNTTGFFIDLYNSGNDNTFSQGKADDDPNTWKWATSSATGKGDIHNAMYHIGRDASNNQWIFIASDRRTTTGTSYIDFEFNQEALTANTSFGFNSGGLDGGRTVNDILLTMEYGNGGSAATVYFYLWEDTGGGNFGWASQTTTLLNAFAQTNTGTINVPFSAFGSFTYGQLQFVEGAVNLTNVFNTVFEPCTGVNIKSLLVKTKQSNASTASLNDFVGPIPVALSFGNAAIIYVNPVCSNSAPVMVTQTGVSGGTYSYVTDTGGPTLSLNTTTGKIDVINSDVGAYTVIYKFTMNGCTKTATTDFTILALPDTPTANASEQPGCDIATGTISVENPNLIWTYTISGPNNFIDSNQTGEFSELAPGEYSIKVTNLDSCTSGPSTPIEINEFIDSEDPEFTCPIPADSYAADDGLCTASLSFGVNPTDNCGVASTVYSVNNSSITYPYNFPTGSTTVNILVTDDNGNSSSCNFNVVVNDEEAPSITCPGDINQGTNDGDNLANCAGLVDLTLPGISDNCDGTNASAYTITYALTGVTSGNGIVPASNVSFNVGETTVTYIVVERDNANNSTTCSFTVTIEDNEDPEFTCPIPAASYAADSGLCTASLDFSVNPTDNCGVASTVYSVNNSSITYPYNFPTGSTTVNILVTDDNGNSSSCNFNVVVNDEEAPSITCPGDINQGTNDSDNAEDCAGLVDLTLPGISDNCDGTNASAYTITYALTGVTSGNGSVPASNVSFNVGETTVTYTVAEKDNANNSTSCSFTVTIEDNENPTIFCAANQNQSADEGLNTATVTVTPPATNDNCGVASVVNNFNGTADASGTYTLGITKIIWTVTDIHGNTNTCDQDITITDEEVPVINCSADQTPTADADACNAYVVVNTPSATDNNQVASVTNDYNDTDDASGIYPVGTTTVTWTVTDNDGNSSSCTLDIIVTDDQDPSITCAADQSQPADAGVCTAAITVIAPATNDNCGVQSVTNDFNGTADASGTYPVGTTVVTWTVTDIHNNTNTCVQNITVTDDQDPSITCAADQSQPADAGVCTATVTVTAPATNDNCGVQSVTNDFNGTADASGTYPVGTTVVTWTVTDIHDNTNTCVQNITVTDNQDPSITCAADQSQPADAGVCNAAVTVIAPATNDNCEVASVVNDFNGTANASGTYPVGTTVVTWTVTDIHDNTNTCVQNITVIDDQLPVITAGDNIDTTADNGLCSAALTIVPATAGDNCSVGNPTGTRDDGEALTAPYPAGTTTITWSVTDTNGNQALAVEQTVTVSDNEKPTISCPADVVVDADTGECTASEVTLGNPTGTDNCDTELSFTNDAPSLFPVGDTMVTWTATDDAGNEITCEQKVTVKDSEKPSITCATNQNQSADEGLNTATVTVTPPETNDNCGFASVVNDFNGTADASGTYPLGITNIIWTVTDIHGNTNTCDQDITITDEEVPVINCSADQTQTADTDACNAFVQVNIPSATDNNQVASVINDYNGTADASGIYPIGTTTVTWTVTDNDGNSSSCTQDIIVTDDQDPTFDPVTNITQNVDTGVCGATVSFSAPTTTDNCEGTVVTLNEGSMPSGSEFPVGTTVVTYTATDAAGNTSTLSFDVTVVDNEAPSIACPDDANQSTEADESYAIVNFENATATDNCSVTVEQTAGLISGSQFPIGESTVTFTATDASGNITDCSFTVTITDEEPPTIVCPANIDMDVDAGICGAVVSFETPTASDNSGSEVTVTQTAGPISGEVFPVGTTTVTFTATDAAGNSASCSFDVTVNDTEDPTFESVSDINANTDAGVCGAVVSFEAPTATDNCDGTVVSLNDGSMASGSEFPVGTTTVTYTATDAAGNTFTVSFDVIVVDNQAPSIACPGNVNQTTDVGESYAIVNFENATATDNCNVTIEQTAGLTSGSQFPIGESTVTFTATDASGNTTECNFTVTVTDDQPDPPIIAEVVQPTCEIPTGTITVETIEGLTYSVGVDYQESGVFSGLEPGTYEVTAQTAGGSTSEITSVTLNEPVAVVIVPNPVKTPQCWDDGSYDLFNLLVGEFDRTGTWENPNSTGALEGSILDLGSFENDLGTYTFNYVISGNCPSTTAVQLTIDDSCIVLDCSIDDIKKSISKAVTPNGDGFNDSFTIGVDLGCGFTFDVKIFNRWGAEIYSMRNYQSNWDGYSDKSFTSSDQLPSGTYFYIIEINGASSLGPIQGYIYLGTK